MRRIIVLPTMAMAALPASAVAQQPAAPAPAPPAPTLALAVERDGPRATVLSRSTVRFRVVHSAHAPGTQAAVRVLRGGRELMARNLTLQPTAGGTGLAKMRYRVRGAGRLSVRATVGELAAPSRRLDVLPRRAGRGSSGGSIRVVQRRLRARGYVVGRSGRWDARTARAVLAFRKVTGMARTSRASSAVMRRLARGGGAFRIRKRSHGRHIEADLSRQVIALIDRGRVRRIYPTSSGAPGTPTVRGSFRVYRKDFGANAIGMVHSSYFIGGYAIHGYRSVPTYNASHGCLRVPIADALSIFRWVRGGTRVDVYR